MRKEILNSDLTGSLQLKAALLSFFLLSFSFHPFNVFSQVQSRLPEVSSQTVKPMDEVTRRKVMKGDGLSDAVIDVLIAEQRKLEQTGRTIQWAGAKGGHPVQTLAATCGDMGVENGWGDWQWQQGTYNVKGQPPNWAGSPAADPGACSPNGYWGPYYAITSGSGIDRNTPSQPGDPAIPVVCPGFGNHSIRIGDTCGSGSIANQLTYSFLVGPADTVFTYAYAVVIENGNHAADEQPFVEFKILDGNGKSIDCSPHQYIGGPGLPGFYALKAGGCGFPQLDQYKPWTMVGINLSKFVGQTLTAVITNVDCVQGGHFCYSYWDFICGTAKISSGCVGNQSSICAPFDPQINYNYQWYHNGVIIPGQNSGCITATPTANDTFKVLVTPPNGLCPFTMSYVPSVLVPGFKMARKCDTVVFVDTSVVTPSTTNLTGWSWSFPGGTPATASTQTASVVYNSAGTHIATCTVTCSAGCFTSVTHTVTTSSFVPAFTSTTPCIGHDLTITDGTQSPGDPVTSWNWTMADATPSTCTYQNPTATYTAAGTHTVTLVVTTQGGCKDSLTQTVTVSPPPVAAFTGNNVCFNNLSTFTDQSTGNGTISNWDWSFGDGNTSTQQNPQHTFTTVGDHTVTLAVTNNLGCKDNDTITVRVHPLPVTSFSLTPVCFALPACITNLSTISTGTISTWSWNFGDPNSGAGNISNAQNDCHVYSAPGTYTVLLTATSDSGCQTTKTMPVTVNPLPVAAFLPTNPCLGMASTLTDQSLPVVGDPVVSWNWNIPGGNPATAATQNALTTYQTAGTHSVTLIITSQAGCKDTIGQQVLVYVAPVSNFSAPDSGCSPVIANFNDLSSSADGAITGWQWAFPGGSPGVSTSSAPTGIKYSTPGTYSVSLVVNTIYGCKDTLALPMIKVFPWPVADFCVSPDIQPTTDPVFDFCDKWSADVVQWSWNFGDNDTDTVSINPVHSYSATATQNDFYHYNICIQVQNKDGCADTACKSVELIPEFTFYIPNTFTPNQDLNNDFFFGKCRGVKEYNIWVFDRWGNQVWDCHKEGQNTNWDSDVDLPKEEGLASACQWDGIVVQGGADMGGSSKRYAEEDVYVWKVKLTDVFNKQHTYVGHVNLVK